MTLTNVTLSSWANDYVEPIHISVLAHRDIVGGQCDQRMEIKYINEKTGTDVTFIGG